MSKKTLKIVSWIALLIMVAGIAAMVIAYLVG